MFTLGEEVTPFPGIGVLAFISSWPRRCHSNLQKNTLTSAWEKGDEAQTKHHHPEGTWFTQQRNQTQKLSFGFEAFLSEDILGRHETVCDYRGVTS